MANKPRIVVEGDGGEADPPPNEADVAAPAVKPATRKFRATIFPTTPDVDPDFAALVAELENALGYKLWLLVHGRADDDWNAVDRKVCAAFRAHKAEIVPNEKVGLLIDLPGGHAQAAYEIVRLFQRRTAHFNTIVPLYAKSAATLITIGGHEILMGTEAELGPLDVQIYDPDREEWDSALNAVQSFERLNAYALMAYDQAMILFASRMGKKPQFLMPYALQYATSIVGPMAEKIDTAEVTAKSRELKVAEDYAIRIMRPNYPLNVAERIARNLVQQYSTHSFVIDRTEAGTPSAGRGSAFNLGLNITEISQEIEALFTKMAPYLEEDQPVLGRIVEVAS